MLYFIICRLDDGKVILRILNNKLSLKEVCLCLYCSVKYPPISECVSLQEERLLKDSKLHLWIANAAVVALFD